MLGIIGGSGLYSMPGLEIAERRSPKTPFGTPSDTVILGSLGESPIAFLARHGAGHRHTPSELPYRANIYALKDAGVTRLLTVSAVGSLQESLPPRSVVLPSQIIDRTAVRPRSFFGEGVVAHVGLGDPYCESFSGVVASAAHRAGHNVVSGGTYVCIEGPQFSTRAESRLFRSWGGSIIGMTAMPEARLAREAEMCYATLAMVTDFDVWHEHEEDVHVDLVRSHVARNTATAHEIIRELCRAEMPPRGCMCRDALAGAIITDPAAVDRDSRARVGIIADRYLPPFSI